VQERASLFPAREFNRLIYTLFRPLWCSSPARMRHGAPHRRGPGRFRVAARKCMIYRKGELSAAGVNRGWPYQVALAAEQVTGR